MTSENDDSAKQMAEKAKNWLASKEGQSELQELFKRTEQAKQDFSEASEVDLDSLKKPVTL